MYILTAVILVLLMIQALLMDCRNGLVSCGGNSHRMKISVDIKPLFEICAVKYGTVHGSSEFMIERFLRQLSMKIFSIWRHLGKKHGKHFSLPRKR